jgi:hypothetical protein
MQVCVDCLAQNQTFAGRVLTVGGAGKGEQGVIPATGRRAARAVGWYNARIRQCDSRPAEVHMADRPLVTLLVSIITVILTLSVRAQQKAFMQYLLQGMVPSDLGDGLLDLLTREGNSPHVRECPLPVTANPGKIRGTRAILAGLTCAQALDSLGSLECIVADRKFDRRRRK